jgi:hypothetical protein
MDHLHAALDSGGAAVKRAESALGILSWMFCLTIRNRFWTRAGRASPPFCMDVGLAPVKTLVAQIWQIWAIAPQLD